eukprot:scaffold29320_cov35-Tisochrysis_lutea.AAC.3
MLYCAACIYIVVASRPPRPSSCSPIHPLSTLLPYCEGCSAYALLLRLRLTSDVPQGSRSKVLEQQSTIWRVKGNSPPLIVGSPPFARCACWSAKQGAIFVEGRRATKQELAPSLIFRSRSVPKEKEDHDLNLPFF